MTDIAFEHFDPEVELNMVDENGLPIRPRKKPGRKPNPPSAAQRKAQNRAAQRAFRERKRREMCEAETNVKRYQQQYDLALKDAQQLRKKNDELRFENHYLKGLLLTFKLTCTANRVNVPKFWDAEEVDDLGADVLTLSRTDGIPQSLEIYLDRQQRIVNLQSSTTVGPPSSCSSTTSATFPSSVPSETSPTSIPSLSPALSCVGNLSSLQPLPSSVAEQLAAFASSTSSPMTQAMLQTPDILPSLQNLSAFTSSSANPLSTLPLAFPSSKADEDVKSLFDTFVKGYMEPNTANMTNADTTAGPTLNIPTSIDPIVTPEKLGNTVPPMSARDAVQYIHTLNTMRGNSLIEPLFTPTEMQQSIPHDRRIDLVPGPAMRDQMILFQEFYDPNELFAFLVENAFFMGGEIGNPDCWFVPPSFVEKYWYLCPNNKPKQRSDNVVDFAVDAGQRLLNLMHERKKMYINRESHLDYFPCPNKTSTSSPWAKPSTTDLFQDAFGDFSSLSIGGASALAALNNTLSSGVPPLDSSAMVQ